MPRFASSDLGLHCLPMSHKKDAIGLYGLMRSYSCHVVKHYNEKGVNIILSM